MPRAYGDGTYGSGTYGSSDVAGGIARVDFSATGTVEAVIGAWTKGEVWLDVDVVVRLDNFVIPDLPIRTVAIARLCRTVSVVAAGNVPIAVAPVAQDGLWPSPNVYPSPSLFPWSP